MKLLDSLAPAAAVAAALTLTLAAPAYAGDKSDDIVVSSKSAMVEWQSDTTRRLDTLLARAPAAKVQNPSDGIVQVTFTLGADGKPTNIKVLETDANWIARRSAVYAVKRLGDLSDVPVNNPQGAKFLANLIFADSIQMREQLAASLDTQRRTRFAATGTQDEYIVLGG